MDRLEILERLAASTAGLTPTSGVSGAELDELRQLLATDLRASTAPGRRGSSHRFGFDRVDLDTVELATRGDLERAVDVSLATADAHGVAPAYTRVARRMLPFSSSAEPELAPGVGRRPQGGADPRSLCRCRRAAGVVRHLRDRSASLARPGTVVRHRCSHSHSAVSRLVPQRATTFLPEACGS